MKIPELDVTGALEKQDTHTHSDVEPPPVSAVSESEHLDCKPQIKRLMMSLAVVHCGTQNLTQCVQPVVRKINTIKCYHNM